MQSCPAEPDTREVDPYVILLADARWYLVGHCHRSGEARVFRLDRVFGMQGVVDFIDVGIGTNRFWTFNIADSGITVGAILLILGSLFEKEDQRPA